MEEKGIEIDSDIQVNFQTELPKCEKRQAES